MKYIITIILSFYIFSVSLYSQYKAEYLGNNISIVRDGQTINKMPELKDNDILEKIDIIKMDIEGSEYNALIGYKNHIINDNPILLISVYHNNEDLWKLPKLIYDYNNNYNFYLRFYGNNIFPTEIVLFAVPK